MCAVAPESQYITLAVVVRSATSFRPLWFGVSCLAPSVARYPNSCGSSSPEFVEICFVAAFACSCCLGDRQSLAKCPWRLQLKHFPIFLPGFRSECAEVSLLHACCLPRLCRREWSTLKPCCSVCLGFIRRYTCSAVISADRTSEYFNGSVRPIVNVATTV